MSRIQVISNDIASTEQQALFDAIKAELGVVPNFLRIFANSPVALSSFLGLYGVAKQGSLDLATRERIALAIAQQNSCEYCLSAHTTLGKNAGLSADEISANRAGSSQDAKAAVAVRLARSLMENLGEITTAELIEARNAGFSESDIVEIITHVGLNMLTNMIGKASRVEIDFPKVTLA